RRSIANAMWLSTALLLMLTAIGGLSGAERAQVQAPEADASAEYQAPDTISVTISVSESGEFSYSRNPIKARRGDVIQWSCDSGNWSIQVEGLRDEQAQTIQRGQTPFGENVRSTQANRGVAKGLAVAGNATFGTYKYSVTVEVDGNELTDDPEIIIGPRG
ncbi:MAG: hypothetical protein JSU87_17285, partial [Gemmatimonadota bacterium]